MMFKCYSMFMMLAGLLLAACGGSSGGDAGTVEVSASVIAAGEGTIVEGAGAFTLPATITMGDSAANQRSIGILCFDLTGISVVHQATLSINRVANLGDALTFGPLYLDHIDGGGILDAADLTDPAIQAGVHMLTDRPSWLLDLTAQVAADLAAGRTASTFRLRFDMPTDGDAFADRYRIASSNHITEAIRPMLLLTIPQ